MKPILLDFPMPIRTHQLLIRPPMPGDGAELCQAIHDSFAELQPWMPWAKQLPTLEDSEENIREAYAKWILREDLRLMIFDLTGKTLIGSTGFHRIHWGVPRVEIGYWVRTPYARKGLMTEATAALTQYAFQVLKARRVEIRCDSMNHASKKIPERLGFELEACLKCSDTVPHGSQLRDTVIYLRLHDQNLPDVGARWN